MIRIQAFLRVDFAMSLKKTILFLSLCVMTSLQVVAEVPFKLPVRHAMIADAEVERASACKGSVMSKAMDEARKHSPFIGMELPEPAREVLSPVADKMVNYAKRFLGTRYRLGATGPRAFDCSGFTGYVYRNFGISLDRTSREQFLQGEHVGVGNLRPGDLLFFSSRSSGRGNVGHVAMVVSVDPSTQTCKFIHASVKKGVTYQTFPDGGYYQRNFIGARRILGTELDLSEAVAQN